MKKLWMLAALFSVVGLLCAQTTYIIEDRPGLLNNGDYVKAPAVTSSYTTSARSTAAGVTQGNLGMVYCTLSIVTNKVFTWNPSGLTAGARNWQIDYTGKYLAGNYGADNCTYNVKIWDGSVVSGLVNLNGANCRDLWYTVGTFSLDTSNSPYFQVDLSSCATNGGVRLYTDAVKFTDMGVAPVTVSQFGIE